MQVTVAGLFDPYSHWFGISPEEQPPNCYRLLGLSPFEADGEAIARAAEQRIAALRAHVDGPQGAEARRLLNYVEAARVRLLDSYKKEMYDRQLREELAKSPAAAEGANPLGRRKASAPQGPRAGDATRTGRGDAPRPEPLAATVAAPGQLGEYQLLEKIGEGGMGAVYKAFHTKLGRVVALKLLSDERLRDENAVARFDREMKAVGAVDHVNVVRAMDAREVDGTRFLVMEYVEGLDLNELSKRRAPLSVAEVCEIARQAALGLDDIHRHGLVHRDIKPSNLMVTPQGVVKLLDLGLARFQAQHHAQEEVTDTGTAMGTVDYMAPEQIGDARTVDIRADIYSLGCTLYKLLSGRTPFSGERYRTAGQKMAAHLRDAPPPITEHCPGLPSSLAALVMRMLAKDPAKRPNRPAEIADAVGPLASTANLPETVRRATSASDGDSAQPTIDPQAGQETHTSSSMTRFFREMLGSGPRRRGATAAASAASGGSRRSTLLAAAATLAVLVAAVGGIWATYHFTRPAMPRLTLDIADEHRAGLVVRIDDAYPSVPDEGPIELAYAPGEHEVYLQRPGYETAVQKVRLAPGQRLAFTPTWRPTPNVEIAWPSSDRQFGRLEIDGAARNLDTPDALRFALSPGRHRLVMDRVGYETIDRWIDVVEGRQETITPDWRPQRSTAPPPATAATPSAGKPDPGKTDPGKAEPDKAEPGKTDPAKPAVIAKSDAAKPPAAGPDTPKTVAKSEPAKGALMSEAASRLAESRRRAAAEWTKQAGASDAKAAAWDFAGAKAALANAAFVDVPLVERLRLRRDALDRMAALKMQLIARLNAAEPRLKKSDLSLRGVGGEVTSAGEEGISARLITGKDELRPWNDLGDRALPKLLQKAVDADRAADWLAAGLVALNANDAVLAEKLLVKAKSLGTDIAPYVVPLAEAALARADSLVAQRQFAEADSALDALEEVRQKHDLAAWRAGNAALIEALRSAAARGLRDAESEKLYRQAAALFAKKELFDVKPLVEQLKQKHAESPAATDAARKPSLAEMDKAVAALGKRFVVRQDGRGDFAAIQAAIDAATANSLIEIRDNGPYYEKVHIPADKPGITLRGGRGYWPIVRSGGPLGTVVELVNAEARNTTLERLIIAHTHGGGFPAAIQMNEGGTARSVMWFEGGRNSFGPRNVIENCLSVDSIGHRIIVATPSLIRNSVFVRLTLTGEAEARLDNVIVVDGVIAECRADVRHMTTIIATLNAAGAVRDSIFQEIICNKPGSTIEFCDASKGRFVELARAGKGCFSADPRFIDEKNLDYRLHPASLCRGRASDGGDLGCRYTPEIVELIQTALELRRRGVIKF